MAKVMIIEDDPSLSKAVQTKLEQEGFEVVVKNDSEGVVSSLLEAAPDILLLDIMMPGKDGYAVLKEIKESKANGLPILIVSNLNQVQDREKALKLGAVGYFFKSQTNLSDLVDDIQGILSGQTSKTLADMNDQQASDQNISPQDQKTETTEDITPELT